MSISTLFEMKMSPTTSLSYKIFQLLEGRVAMIFVDMLFSFATNMDYGYRIMVLFFVWYVVLQMIFCDELCEMNNVIETGFDQS